MESSEPGDRLPERLGIWQPAVGVVMTAVTMNRSNQNGE